MSAQHVTARTDYASIQPCKGQQEWMVWTVSRQGRCRACSLNYGPGTLLFVLCIAIQLYIYTIVDNRARASILHILRAMESAVRLCKPFTCGALRVNRQNRVMRRRASRQAGERSTVTQASVQASNKSVFAKWAEDAGLRTNVSLEDFLGDRCCNAPCCSTVQTGTLTLLESKRCVQHSLLSSSAGPSLFTSCCIRLHASASALVACDHLFALGRTESLKPPPNGPVTWPSEQWTSMWKASGHSRMYCYLHKGAKSYVVNTCV